MNKKIIIICAIFVLILAFCFWNFWYGYSAGKDTYEYFGNGRYQILNNSEKSYSFVDLEDYNVIENTIYMYYNDKQNSEIYIYGIDGYAIINYEDNIVNKYNYITEIPSKYNVFNQNDLFKKLVSYLPSENTICFFGDGTYQIYKNSENEYVLKNNKTSYIINNINKYLYGAGKLYIIKENSYIYIDIINDKIIQFDNLNNFEDEIKSQFMNGNYFKKL